jgi:hypothetical protein
MKTLTKEIWVNVPTRRAIVSIHDEVARLVAQERGAGGADAVQCDAHHGVGLHQ